MRNCAIFFATGTGGVVVIRAIMVSDRWDLSIVTNCDTSTRKSNDTNNKQERIHAVYVWVCWRTIAAGGRRKGAAVGGVSAEGRGGKRRLIYEGNFSLFLSWLRHCRRVTPVASSTPYKNTPGFGNPKAEYLHNTTILSSHAADGNYISEFLLFPQRTRTFRRTWRG